MKKLVIFDLDGTLLDTIYDMQDSINYMLNKYNYGKIDIESIKHFIGNGARNLVIKSLNYCGQKLSDEKIDDCLKTYNDYYTSSNSPKTKIFEGLSDVLNVLKNRGYILSIITNKPQMTTDTVNNRYLKQFDFSYVLGSSSDRKIKPDPTETLKLIDKIGVDKCNTYFIGDGETDVLTAKNADINGIAVLWGYRSKEELLSAGASVFANIPSDLLKILK